MKILFGGSFDPFHLGHLSIIKGVIEKYNPGKFFIVPANQSMSKIKYVFPPGLRLKMIEKSLSDLPNEMRNCIEISDFELIQDKPVYTYETVAALKPDTLLIGGDHNYAKWKNFSEIIEPSVKQFLIYPRNNNPKSPRSVKEIILDLPEFQISSMEVIEKLYSSQRLNQLVHHSIVKELEQYRLENELPDRIEKKNDLC
jgi:nicotinate-nucleotide adenylyltransferase